MYAKLVDGQLLPAPNRVEYNGSNIWNPPVELYIELGWKPVVYVDPIEEAPSGYQYLSNWEETNTEIQQTWSLAPLSDELSEDEVYSIIFGGAE